VAAVNSFDCSTAAVDCAHCEFAPTHGCPACDGVTDGDDDGGALSAAPYFEAAVVPENDGLASPSIFRAIFDCLDW
jgi:hypothetical protein